MQGAPKRKDGEEAVPFPPLKTDRIRRSTVLPYLEAFNYASDLDNQDVYFTEHDINRKWPAMFDNRMECNNFVFITEEYAKQAAEAAQQMNDRKKRKSSSAHQNKHKSVSCISVKKLTHCRQS